MAGFRPRFFITDAAPAGVGAHGGGADLAGVVLPLSPEDSHHATRVLRLQPGDECEVVVGVGAGGAAFSGAADCGAAVYAAAVSAAAGLVQVRLTTRLQGADVGACYKTQVGLVQALGRPAAMEYVLEKGTEVGAGFFCLVRAPGSPKRAELVREDHLTRWRRIVREAAKQSKQVAIPEVTVVTSVDEAIRVMDERGTFSIVLDLEATDGLQEVVPRIASDGLRTLRIALWIGPEGGWTPADSEQFSVARMEAARLGRSVLRTETAGPVAVAVTRLALGDW